MLFPPTQCSLDPAHILADLRDRDDGLVVEVFQEALHPPPADTCEPGGERGERELSCVGGFLC